MKFGQDYADKAEEAGGLAARLLSKRGTPTMGGILIVTVLVFSTMLWAHWNAQVELTLLSVLVLSGLGFYDDYAKIIQQSGGGTPPRVKLLVQTALGLFVGIYLWKLPATSELRFPGKKSVIVMHSNLVSDMMLPFCKYPYEVGAIVGVLIVLLAIVGSSNAVNLTDGLDGLAIGCTLIVAFVFLIFTYLAGNSKAAEYLQIPFVPRRGRTDRFLRGVDRRGSGIFMVQLSSGAGVHGRHGFARAGRRVRHHRGADSSAVRAGDRGRNVCYGSGLGDHPDAAGSDTPKCVTARAGGFF